MSCFLSSFVISFTFFSKLILLFLIITGIIFFGSKSFNAFFISLFWYFLKSLNILSSSFSALNAGFMSTIIWGFIILVLTKCDDALNIIGPETPKWVNSISPKSLYMFFLFSINCIDTFFKVSPCNSWQSCNEFFVTVIATSDGFISVIVWPNFFAISYPSPVDPVNG